MGVLEKSVIFAHCTRALTAVSDGVPGQCYWNGSGRGSDGVAGLDPGPIRSYSLDMNENALRIVTLAVELLARWDWSKGEPLAALTMASLRLFGSELHAEISSIRTAEKEFLPGSQSNNADARLAALRAVIKFRAKTIGVAMG